MLARIREIIKNTFSKLHAPVYRLTGGRIGGRWRDIPLLLLTTTGRKSGKLRTWPLLYFRNQGRYVLIASNWGQDHDPAWVLNLRNNPEATIQVRGETIDVTAEEATGEERERLWRGAIQAYSGYERYQQRTERQIPVVVLTPLENGAAH
jgi:F420H(2)-dependent quinone reductase